MECGYPASSVRTRRSTVVREMTSFRRLQLGKINSHRQIWCYSSRLSCRTFSRLSDIRLHITDFKYYQVILVFWSASTVELPKIMARVKTSLGKEPDTGTPSPTLGTTNYNCPTSPHSRSLHVRLLTSTSYLFSIFFIYPVFLILCC